jgi:hypothetical protein
MSEFNWGWRLDAACAGHPHPEWFDCSDGFNERPDARNARHEQALAVCRTCPVVQECADAVDPERDEGVRGGRVLPALKRPADYGDVPGTRRAFFGRKRAG